MKKLKNKILCKDCGHSYKVHTNFYVKCICGNGCRGVDGWCEGNNKECNCAEYIADNLKYLEQIYEQSK